MTVCGWFSEGRLLATLGATRRPFFLKRVRSATALLKANLGDNCQAAGMTYPTELCAIAASYLLAFVSMYDAAGNGPNPNAGQKGLVFEDTHSDRSFSTDILDKLGLIGSHNLAGWTCVVDKDQTLSFFLQRGLSDAEREQLVGEYLMTLCEWEGIPTTRNDFILPANANRLRTALIKHGLCEERGGALRWSDYAGPAMRAGKQWDSQDSSVDEAKDRAIREEAERIWASLSDGMKDKLIRETDELSVLVVSKLLGEHRDGIRWEARADIWPPVEFPLAKAFFDLVRKRQATGGLIDTLKVKDTGSRAKS